MLDLKFVVDNGDAVKANAATKKAPCDVDRVIALNDRRKVLAQQIETHKADLNRINKAVGPIIGMLKKSGGHPTDTDRQKITDTLDKTVNKTEQPDLHDRLRSAIEAGVETLQETLRALGDETAPLETERDEVESELFREMARIPNMLDPSAPPGTSAADNVVVREHGDKRTFDFAPKQHWELGEALGMMQVEASAKLSGSGFALLTGDLARLEWALISYFLDKAAKNGYAPCMVPLLVKEPVMFGTGYLPKMADQVYRTDDRDDLFLIPTAEAPLTSIHANEMLSAEALPKRYTAWSACFRREAGAWGKETRGLLRVHQFHKVELFKLTRPEDSAAEHEALTRDAEGILRELGLPYRVLELCGGDMSFAAAKCYDLEVFSPGADQWLEVSSCSNFHDFQARRCEIRYRDPDTGKPRYCHTINGSGLATPRMMVAIMETFQNADGSITVPDPLRPFMAGQTRIGS